MEKRKNITDILGRSLLLVAPTTPLKKGEFMSDIKLLPNIDTICILLDIENYEKNSKDIINYLLSEKEKIKEIQLDTPTYKHIINLNDMNFELLSTGKKGYAILLKNEDYEIDIAQYKSKLENFAPIQIRISSSSLWSIGIIQSWSIIYNWIVETFGNIISEKVCRLDLCCHTSEIDFIKDYEISYKGDFKKRQTFYNGSKINCITFGSRKSKNIYCRIYNKTLEIEETHKKYWFYEIWNNYNMDIKNIWNLEFEIKSEFLRRFNINTINDVLLHINDIWQYCTNKWLIKIDRTNVRVERCNISSQWLQIQNAYNQFNSIGLVEKSKQLEIDAKKLIPNIAGFIISYSARKKELNIDKAFITLQRDTQRYLRNKNTDFSKEVKTKLAVFNESEV